MEKMSESLGRKGVVAVAISVVALLIAGVALALPFVSSSRAPSQPSETKEFVVVNSEVEFNETAVGIVHDTFTPNQIVVNQGDKVIIHFYNTEEKEHHTFTIGAPYNINVDLAGGQKQDITFTASYPGVFRFFCTYHLPTMVGELIVLRA